MRATVKIYELQKNIAPNCHNRSLSPQCTNQVFEDRFFLGVMPAINIHPFPQKMIPCIEENEKPHWKSATRKYHERLVSSALKTSGFQNLSPSYTRTKSSFATSRFANTISRVRRYSRHFQREALGGGDSGSCSGIRFKTNSASEHNGTIESRMQNVPCTGKVSLELFDKDAHQLMPSSERLLSSAGSFSVTTESSCSSVPSSDDIPMSQITVSPPGFSKTPCFITKRWISDNLPVNESVTVPVIRSSDIEYVKMNGCYVMIGSGGYANVFLCRFKYSQRLVALKLNGIDSMSVEKFYKECRVQTKLNHTGCTSFLHGIVAMEMSEHYMRLGIVSDFIGDPHTFNTQSLAGLIAEQRNEKLTSTRDQLLTNRDWMALCVDIVKCVSTIHKNLIVVGDIKPDNIMLLKKLGKWKPVVIDFGLSGENETNVDLEVSSLEAASFLQEYRYIPPEFVHHRKLTSASDVYSLSVLLDGISTIAGLHLEEVTELCCSFSPEDRLPIEDLLEIMELQLELLNIS